MGGVNSSWPASTFAASSYSSGNTISGVAGSTWCEGDAASAGRASSGLPLAMTQATAPPGVPTAGDR